MITNKCFNYIIFNVDSSYIEYNCELDMKFLEIISLI